MVFSIFDCKAGLATARKGLSRFRQSTALIGATLIFCLPVGAAYAETLYYNYNGPTGSPAPQSGGIWVDANSNQNWIVLDLGDIANPDDDVFIPGPERFRSDDLVHFTSASGSVIELEIEGTVDPGTVDVDRGSFEFNDNNGDGRLVSEQLTIASGAQLILDVDAGIDGVGPGNDVTVNGGLLVRAGRTLTSADGVVVNGGGALTLNGRIAGGVTVNSNGVLNFGADSRIVGELELTGTGSFTGGRVGSLEVLESAVVSYGGSGAQVDAMIVNRGDLSLGSGSYMGWLINTDPATLRLSGDQTFAGTDVTFRNRGVMTTAGGSRVLSVSNLFENYGLLTTENPSDVLTIEAGTIELFDTTTFGAGANVILSGPLINHANLDLVHVPRLDGTFTNRVGATATVTAATDGNGQDLGNAGTLRVTGGNLIGLDTLTNTGSVQVSSGRTLGATTIQHNAGTFSSAGTLVGEVIANANASIQGEIRGQYEVAGGVTTVTGNLTLANSADGGLVEITNGTLQIGDGITLTTAQLRNADTLALSTLDPNLNPGTTIIGEVRNTGLITGNGTIQGSLIFAGNGSEFTGGRLVVTDAMINERSDAVLLTDFDAITYTRLINRGDLTINAARTLDVTNGYAGELQVNEVISGNLVSLGTTDMRSNLDGRLRVADGVTTIYSNLAGGPVTIGRVGGVESLVEANGSLAITGGDLVVNTNLTAAGSVFLASDRTLTTTQLSITDEGGSLLNGTLSGDLTISSGGRITLDGATVTGVVTNNGSLIDTALVGRPNRFQGSLVNRGRTILDSASQPAIISNRLRNDAGAYAEITGNVIAGASLPGNVSNAGELYLTGNVAGSVSNTGYLEITGNVGTAGTPAAVDVTNGALGTVVIDGNIANSIRNLGTATVAGGVIGGNVVNLGTMDLGSDVTGEIRNGTDEDPTASLNVIGNVQAGALYSLDTTTIRAGSSLDLLSGVLQNGDGATLNLFGTVLSSAAPGGINLQNAAGGVIWISATGEMQGNLTNAGRANLRGLVQGNVINSAGGTLNIADSGEVTGTLQNQGNTVVLAGADATVAGGTTNAAGTMTVQGLLNSDVSNANGATLRIAGGEIVGDVTNIDGGRIISSGTITGNVENSGTYTVDLLSQVDGDFVNYLGGLVTQSTEGSRLVVTGTMTNYGTISSGDFSTIRISADTFQNRGTLDGGVIIDGDLRNSNLITYREDTVLLGRLENDTNGIIRVWATVTGDGSPVINQGRFDVANGGVLTDVGPISNSGIFTIANGSRVSAPSFTNTGSLANSGVLAADVVNRASGTLVSNNTIIGDLRNEGTATLSGVLNGRLTTAQTGTTTIVRNMRITEGALNQGTMQIGAGTTLTSAQAIQNGTMGLLQSSGTIIGDIDNSGRAELSGRVTGTITNRAGQMVVGPDQVLSVNGNLRNIATGVLTLRGEATVSGVLLNSSRAGMTMVAGSRLTGDIENASGGNATLAGTVDGTVLNRGRANVAGTITQDLINEGDTLRTGGDLLVRGEVINRRAPVEGTSLPGAIQRGPGDPATLIVEAGTTLRTLGGLTNDQFSTVIVNGTLVGLATNAGTFNLNNRLQGTLDTSGTANLSGTVTGNVIYRDGSVNLVGDLTVGGIFDAFNDFQVQADRELTVGRYLNRQGQELSVAGTVSGLIENRGTLVAVNGGQIGSLINQGTMLVDTAFDVNGTLTNRGRVDLTGDGAANDVLRVNGNVTGSGVYALDLDLDANGGAGASDRVVVRGGAVTGNLVLSFNSPDEVDATSASRRILVFDIDGSQANDFTYREAGLPAASEQIIYTVVRDGQSGDLFVTDAINPALGALSGNIALTQSLIGSVVNRPSSPFVPGLASDAGDKKCGIGAWARALAGRASATGRTASSDFSIASSIEASYRGLQFGSDLACFEGSVNGWNVAVGAMGGVNDGTTTQPVYVNDPNDLSELTDVLGSINRGEFRQVYGGIYATATRDKWSLDLQMRRERTSFTVDNQPMGEGNEGLQLRNSEFDSNATTVSGSVSYAYQLPREGWTVVPTAGFAFSNLSVDKIYYENNAELEIKDSKNRVGFVGGTLSKTFVNPARNSAMLAFGTATIYKDFAPDTKSVFTMPVGANGALRSDELISSNLGVYSELSLGLNYLKVLDAGSARAPRQFNASIRVDGRAGDVLDSYGVTAQVRLQF